jgi:hypothetical protein
VKLLEYDIGIGLEGFEHLNSSSVRCQMGSIWRGARSP